MFASMWMVRHHGHTIPCNENSLFVIQTQNTNSRFCMDKSICRSKRLCTS